MRESKDAVRARRVLRWAACAAALVVAAGCAPPEPGEGRDPSAALEASLAGLESLARSFPAPGDEPLAWPSDHAFHPQQFTESWLLAGLLRAEDGQRYGFQLLLQRVALTAEEAARDSAWAASAAWQGVFTVEPEQGAPITAERFSREALGLAGAGEDIAAAWLEDWRIEILPESGTGRMRAASENAALELSFRLPDAPPAGTTADARRGYWWPGLDAAGSLVVDGRARPVSGGALLDRSWGQSPPAGRGQLALARSWIQFADGTGMRCEQLRRRGGGGVPLGACTEFPSGRSAGQLPEPAAAEAAAREGRVPLEWRMGLPGVDEATLWTPLADPGAPGVAWSGVIVPVDESESGDPWGFLSLSNFAAP